MKPLLYFVILIAIVGTAGTLGGCASGSKSEKDRELASSEDEIDFASRITAQLEIAHFDRGKHDLTPLAQEIMKRNLALLEAHPGVVIQIEGHCDSRGSEALNLALGQRRADAAKRFLLNRGITSDRIFTMSYGEAMPAAAGETEEALAKNRRVEFRVLSTRLL